MIVYNVEEVNGQLLSSHMGRKKKETQYLKFRVQSAFEE